MFAFLVILEIFLDAVFLWIMPFEAALLITLTAAFNRLPMSSLFFEGNAASNFVTYVFILVCIDWLRRLSFSACRTLLSVDRSFFGAALPANCILLRIAF